jgi:DNA-binding response OmpR family regulator
VPAKPAIEAAETMSPQHHRSLPPVILIGDEDLGFVLWLGHVLAQAGYLALPITSVREILKVLSELRIAAVDLVILNPAWKGARRLMEKLRKQQGPFKVIQIESRDREAEKIDATQAEWLARVGRALQRSRSADDFS